LPPYPIRAPVWHFVLSDWAYASAETDDVIPATPSAEITASTAIIILLDSEVSEQGLKNQRLPLVASSGYLIHLCLVVIILEREVLELC
jgi:hypothetical protein